MVYYTAINKTEMKRASDENDKITMSEVTQAHIPAHYMVAPRCASYLQTFCFVYLTWIMNRSYFSRKGHLGEHIKEDSRVDYTIVSWILKADRLPKKAYVNSGIKEFTSSPQ